MRRLIGVSTTKGAVSPSQRRPAMKVSSLPMPERRLGSQPAPLQTAAAQTRHLGGRSGLVDEHQSMRLKPHPRLALFLPFLSRRADVGAILLAGQQRFF